MNDWRAILAEDSARWMPLFLALDRKALPRTAEDLLAAWVRGDLERALLGALPTHEALRMKRTELAALLTELAGAGIEPEIEHYTDDEQAIRRWCWIQPWLLCGQDEDLLLMNERWYGALLDEAAAGCPKRLYALSIIEHGIRDHTYAELRANKERGRESLRSAQQWIAAADRAVATKLADYCHRLTSYAELSKVDARGALDRAQDVRRCAPALQLEAEQHDQVFRVDLKLQRSVLVVERSTGEMWIEG